MGNNDIYENNEEDEDYPQNNICYECGKQLKWEHMCPDCGVSNLEDEEEETIVTTNHSVYNDLEQKLMDLAEEVRSWKEKSKIERKSDIEAIELLDDYLDKTTEKVTSIEMKMSQDRNTV